MKTRDTRKPLDEISNMHYKNIFHSRQSSDCTNLSQRSQARSNSSIIENKSKHKHRRTISTIIDMEIPSLQQEILKSIISINQKNEEKFEKLRENKKNLKEILRFTVLNKNSEESENPTVCSRNSHENQEKKRENKKNILEEILNHFYPKLEKSENLKEIIRKPMKKFFVAISKNRTFAIYSKETGSWKKIYGDKKIKITKAVCGAKLKFLSKEEILNVKPNKSYNLFILN